jgi:hypothetical protein
MGSTGEYSFLFPSTEGCYGDTTDKGPVKGEKETGFVDRMIAKLKKHVQEDENTEYLDYLENLPKKTK